MSTVLEELACANPDEGQYVAAFARPFLSLFGIAQQTELVFVLWAVVVLIWVVLYYALPVCFLNSSNGFKSGYVVSAWSLALFIVITAIYVLWSRESACKSKRGKALYYVRGQKPALPKEFERAAERVMNKPYNFGRPTSTWSPQAPFVGIPESDLGGE